jgi:hypothetical protein
MIVPSRGEVKICDVFGIVNYDDGGARYVAGSDKGMLLVALSSAPT